MTAPQAEPFLYRHFLGLDWASDHHDAVIVDADGRIVLETRFDDDRDGWESFQRQLAPFDGLAVTLETSSGWVVERLIEFKLPIYPVNPKAAQRFRERKKPSGAKDDKLDAYALADALRTDGRHWRKLVEQSPILQELRVLCRDEESLIAQRTSLINQFRHALGEYFPLALQIFENPRQQIAWDFIRKYPTPEAFHQKGPNALRKFLDKQGVLKLPTAQRRLELVAKGTQPFTVRPAIASAKSRLALAIVDQLVAVQAHLADYRKRIGELFRQHDDADIFSSLPGAGDKLSSRLLAELGDQREVFPDHQDLQTYAGTAPVTKQSGRQRYVVIRRACNKHLRNAVQLWADLSRNRCAWAKTYYDQKIAAGQNPAAAIRCLGQRWLKILWKIWRDRKPYDEAVHTQNQLKVGCWKLSCNPVT